jgi:hypothetical protein
MAQRRNTPQTVIHIHKIKAAICRAVFVPLTR